VEHEIIVKWFAEYNKSIVKDKADKMIRYAVMIHEANQKFNITGLKTREDILNELILGSIKPLINMDVPRGTKFADLGSGAGIPGIALAIYFGDISGVLIESNNKKVKFIESITKELELLKLQVICGRAEDVAADQSFREKYDWCFIRAMGKLYIMTELGAPFVKKDGYLYIYSNIKSADLPTEEIKHIEKLGFRIMSHDELAQKILPGDGLCLIKKTKTPMNYPRKFAVIKRESEVIYS
jgi:16S rRNA (guanine527-N7)-methyltransferase